MKRIIISCLAIAATVAVQAQNPYSNYQMVGTSDVIGTSRYVSMGGAMGALGADISVMSNNPAGIGLYRRNDVSVTMGAQIQEEEPRYGDSRTHFTFDQIGFVAAFPSEFSESSWAFGMNLQKKANFAFSQSCGYNGLNGLSQAAQFRELFYSKYWDFNAGDIYDGTEAALPVRADDAMLYDIADAGGNTLGIRSNSYDYYRKTSGNLYGLDLNISGAINSQVFLGMTLGIDFLRYRSNYQYVEFRDGSDGSDQDYDIISNQRVDGTGFNFKFGTIIRPFEDSPFRFGVAIETPTWYRLTQEDSYYSFASANDNYLSNGDALYDQVITENDGSRSYIYDSYDGNYMDYNVFAPWKFRLSAGSTVENIFAWDIEYEYAMYNKTKMGSPRDYDYDGPSTDMDKDRAMGELNDRVMNGVHNFRVGMEVKPVPELAIRAGYNFFSRPMKKSGRLDQGIGSEAFDYSLSTDYMNLNEAHVFTVGLGYRYKKFYADLAYKYRNQSGDFYAFDDQYQAYGASDPQFMMTSATALQPTEVCLDRHNLTFTLGFKF